MVRGFGGRGGRGYAWFRAWLSASGKPHAVTKKLNYRVVPAATTGHPDATVNKSS